MRHDSKWWGVALGAGILLASCGTAASPTTTTTTTSTTTTSSTTTTTVPSTTTTVAAQNLPITTSLSQSLVAAGAAFHQLAAKDYTGLAAGTTYYAFDPSTATYYAAAALVPSSSSYRAQVSNQDDGSYLLFTHSGSAAWTVYNDGLGGVAGSTCPVMLPASVLAAWQWAAHSCYPPS